MKHFVAWRKFRGIDSALFQEATGIRILSLHKARNIAAELTDLEPIRVDMCPSSCIAYAGGYRERPHVARTTLNYLERI